MNKILFIARLIMTFTCLVSMNISAYSKSIKLNNGYQVVFNYNIDENISNINDKVFSSDTINQIDNGILFYKNQSFTFPQGTFALLLRQYFNGKNNTLICLSRLQGKTLFIDYVIGEYYQKIDSLDQQLNIGAPNYDTFKYIFSNSQKVINQLDFDSYFILLSSYAKKNNKPLIKNKLHHLLTKLSKGLTGRRGWYHSVSNNGQISIVNNKWLSSYFSTTSEFLKAYNKKYISTPRIKVILRKGIKKDSMLSKIRLMPDNFKVKLNLFGYENNLKIKYLDGWLQDGELVGECTIHFEPINTKLDYLRFPKLKFQAEQSKFERAFSLYNYNTITCSFAETSKDSIKFDFNLLSSIDSSKRPYLVKKGDSYYDLSDKYGVPLNDFVTENRFKPRKIPIDSSLNSSLNRTYSRYHIVKKGDSYWSIAALYGIEVTNLISENYWQPRFLPIDEKVFIPFEEKQILMASTFYPDGTNKGIMIYGDDNLNLTYLENNPYFPSNPYTIQSKITANIIGDKCKIHEKIEVDQVYIRPDNYIQRFFDNRILTISKGDTIVNDVYLDYQKGYIKHGKSLNFTSDLIINRVYSHNKLKKYEHMPRSGPPFHLTADYDENDPKYPFKNVRFTDEHGFVTEGKLNSEGVFDGPGRIWYPACEKWYDFPNLHPSISKPMSCTKKWYERLGDELDRWWDDFWDIFNAPFEALDDAICGKTEEDKKNCHLNGGVNVDSDGNYRLTDGNGNVVEIPNTPDPSYNDYIFGEEIIIEEDFEIELKFATTTYLFTSVENVKQNEIPLTVIPPTKSGDGTFLCTIRPADAYSSSLSDLGGSRGARYHAGSDCIVSAGEQIYAPISGVVYHIGFPYKLKKINSNDTFSKEAKLFYANDLKKPEKEREYRTITIKNEDVFVKLLYVKGLEVELGKPVYAGMPIAKSSNLSHLYPPLNGKEMTNHVHMEIKKGDWYYNFDLTKRMKCRFKNGCKK